MQNLWVNGYQCKAEQSICDLIKSSHLHLIILLTHRPELNQSLQKGLYQSIHQGPCQAPYDVINVTQRSRILIFVMPFLQTYFMMIYLSTTAATETWKRVMFACKYVSSASIRVSVLSLTDKEEFLHSAGSPMAGLVECIQQYHLKSYDNFHTYSSENGAAICNKQRCLRLAVCHTHTHMPILIFPTRLRQPVTTV